MGHKDDVKFRDIGYMEEQEAVVLMETPDGVVVTSRCPRCEGDSPWLIPISRPGGGVKPERFDRVETIEGERTDVICQCGNDHTRPEDSDELGCGATWPVRLVRKS